MPRFPYNSVMDLRHLRAFVAVAEESSFTRAARRLHLSQPPLSRHVRQLEDELGVTLFVRRRDGIELTAEGRVLLEKARSASTAVAAFQDAAASLKDPRARPLRLGIGWGLWSAVDRIRVHHAKRFPDVQISAADLCAERHPAQEQEIDVALLRPPIDEAQYDSELLFEEQFVAIVSQAHPLASRRAVRLAELAWEPLLMYDRCIGPGVYDKTLALYRAADMRPQIVQGQPAPYSQAAMMLVATRQGIYIGIASPFTQTHCARGVGVVPLDEPNARFEVRIVWRKNESCSGVLSFLQSAREVFRIKPAPSRSNAV
jgi:DNA-binding transcriptional LysR family regulator